MSQNEFSTLYGAWQARSASKHWLLNNPIVKAGFVRMRRTGPGSRNDGRLPAH